jgi:Uma2 family endonuclease
MAKVLFDRPETEYLLGRPYPKVSPKRTHALVQFAIATILRQCAGHRGNVGTEWRFHISASTEFVPDVAFVSFERLRTLTDVQAEEPPFAPDIAVEVRALSRRPRFESSKITAYLSAGAQLVLDIDPQTRTVHAVTADAARDYGAGKRFAHPAIDWLIFDVDELFQDLKIPR